MTEIESVPGQLSLFVGWYDRDHKPITSATADKSLMDPEARRVAGTYIGSAWVSTVFLFLDHGLGDGPFPVLYETMVFRLNRDADGLGLLEPDWRGGWDRRYCFPLEAIVGHAMAVGALRLGRELPPGTEHPDTPVRAYLDA